MIGLGLQRLTDWFDAYVAGTKGNVSIIFAVAAIPILLTAGVAIDFSRAENMRTRLQVATDSAALAGASMEDASDGQRIQMAKDFLGENLSGLNVSPVSQVTVSDGEITVEVTKDLDNSLMRLAGLNSTSVATTATAVWLEGPGDGCIYALDTGETSGSLKFSSMNNAELYDCVPVANSTHDQAITTMQILSVA